MFETSSPQLYQVADVGLEGFFGQALGDRAHDDATGGRLHRLVYVAQASAFTRRTDALRDTDVFDRGQIHDVAARQRDVAGGACAFGADRLFRDLDDYFVALFDDLGDGH